MPSGAARGAAKEACEAAAREGKKADDEEEEDEEDECEDEDEDEEEEEEALAPRMPSTCCDSGNGPSSASAATPPPPPPPAPPPPPLHAEGHLSSLHLAGPVPAPSHGQQPHWLHQNVQTQLPPPLLHQQRLLSPPPLHMQPLTQHFSPPGATLRQDLHGAPDFGGYASHGSHPDLPGSWHGDLRHPQGPPYPRS